MCLHGLCGAHQPIRNLNNRIGISKLYEHCFRCQRLSNTPKTPTRVALADNLLGDSNKSNKNNALKLVLMDSSSNIGLIWSLKLLLDTG